MGSTSSSVDSTPGKRRSQPRKKLETLTASIATSAASNHDPVNHPSHYTSHPSGVECIDVVEWMNFNRGNAMKYIWRAGEKGDEIEDLRKAAWYLNREIERLTKGAANATT